MSELAVTAIGADRPGIIARVTEVLLRHGGNLEDCSMTILRGQFAMMLLVITEADPQDLEVALQEATRDLGLVVTVRALGEGSESAPPTHILSVYGKDRPGLVHAVSGRLAEAGVNVTDLNTRVLEGEHAVYAMMFEISLPSGTDEAALLSAVTNAADVEATLQPLDAATF